MKLKSPYPWFGGKSTVADKIWERFGDCKVYVEPFYGSGAVHLLRPQPFEGVETINDKDGMVSNFWRAVQADPEQVANYANWPQFENDLHARHAWLVSQKESLQEQLEGNPDYYDCKIAGWWVWGISIWTIGGFCFNTHRTRPDLSSNRGVVRDSLKLKESGLQDYMVNLANRFKCVRVCCGDWKRVCGGNSGNAIACMVKNVPCAVFLDPPYADTAKRTKNIYSSDSLTVAHEVREWAIAHGDDPRFRICLAGYEGEHNMPDSWECVAWKAHGGFANNTKNISNGKINKDKERLWFSPHCIKPENTRNLWA